MLSSYLLLFIIIIHQAEGPYHFTWKKIMEKDINNLRSKTAAGATGILMELLLISLNVHISCFIVFCYVGVGVMSTDWKEI